MATLRKSPPQHELIRGDAAHQTSEFTTRPRHIALTEDRCLQNASALTIARFAGSCETSRSIAHADREHTASKDAMPLKRCPTQWMVVSLFTRSKWSSFSRYCRYVTEATVIQEAQRAAQSHNAECRKVAHLILTSSPPLTLRL